jgi:replication factor A1
MTVNPPIDEAFNLKGWYDAQGQSTEFIKHENTGLGAATGQRDQVKTILQVKDENLGMSDTPDYFTIKATIIYIKPDTFAYPACKSEGCNKKVIEQEPGNWRCEKCDRSHPEPEYRFITSINVSDHTGQIWLSCFDDSGRLILGRSANDLTKLKEEDEKAAAEVFQDAMCQTFLFRCRARMDTIGDTPRYVLVLPIDSLLTVSSVRYQVNSATQLNYVNEAAKLIKQIKMYD